MRKKKLIVIVTILLFVLIAGQLLATYNHCEDDPTCWGDCWCQGVREPTTGCWFHCGPDWCGGVGSCVYAPR